MFKKTAPNPQPDLFTAPVMQLGSRASKKYSDPQAWHNQFYSLVTTKIDKEIFMPLFPEGKKIGRPNALIRVLVGMLIMKEGYGCCDEDSYCNHGCGNILIRRNVTQSAMNFDNNEHVPLTCLIAE